MEAEDNAPKSDSSLEQLPPELLLKVLCFSPDLSSLHSLLLASAHVSRVFLQAARHVTDAVLSASLPVSTQAAARTVVRLRVSAHKCREIADVSKLAQNLPPQPPRMPSAAEPDLLRRFVALAHDVHCLTHMCLESHLAQCLSLRPARPPEGHLSAIPTPEEGHPYEVPAQEPPSWIEEQRMLRDMWLVQVYRETQTARLKGRLAWTQEKMSLLDGLSTELFYRFGATYRREQMLTVVEFLDHLSGGVIKPWHRLYTFEGSFHHRCAPEPQRALEENNRHQGRDSLNHRPAAWFIHSFMANDGRVSLRQMHFKPYRRYGFAIWDIKRMTNLGFYTKDRAHFMSNPYRVYFTWLSILTDEERIDGAW